MISYTMFSEMFRFITSKNNNKNINITIKIKSITSYVKNTYSMKNKRNFMPILNLAANSMKSINY